MVPVIRNGAILFLLITVGLTFLKATNSINLMRGRIVTWGSITIAFLLLTVYPSPASTIVMFERIALKLLCLLILTLPFLIEEYLGWSRRILILVFALAISSWLFLIFGLLNLLPQSLANFVQSKIVINNIQNDDLTRLSLRFKEKSNKQDLILTPPSLTRFRYHSQRSLVYTFYTSPYTDRGLKEWANRLKAIAGIINPPLSWRNIDSYYRKRSNSELIKLAKQYDANYILTRSTWHPNLSSKVFDREGTWVIYQVDENKNWKLSSLEFGSQAAVRK